jgi:DNA-directed RNA polymerase specialized sigma24 family protein
MVELLSIDEYKCMSDEQLVQLTLEGNEEAALFLIYKKYEVDLKYHIFRLYNSLEYIEELNDELYMQLKGTNRDWAPLKTFKWKSSFRTWFNSVASNLFLKKRKELIDLEEASISISQSEGQIPQPLYDSNENPNSKKVILLEAISRLSNQDYRFIIIKELEGYSAQEIAALLSEKREKENRLRRRTTEEGDQVITPDRSYIYMIRCRAVKELKKIVEQIKEEWYGNK